MKIFRVCLQVAPSHVLGTRYAENGRPGARLLPSGGLVGTRRCIALHAKAPANTKLARAIELA